MRVDFVKLLELELLRDLNVEPLDPHSAPARIEVVYGDFTAGQHVKVDILLSFQDDGACACFLAQLQELAQFTKVQVPQHFALAKDLLGLGTLCFRFDGGPARRWSDFGLVSDDRAEQVRVTRLQVEDGGRVRLDDHRRNFDSELAIAGAVLIDFVNVVGLGPEEGSAEVFLICDAFDRRVRVLGRVIRRRRLRDRVHTR